METLKEYLPFLIPLLIIQFFLIVVSLSNIFKHKNYKCGNRLIWTLVVIFINIIGPVLYFIIGRDDN